MFIACIWCAVSPNIISVRASRVVEGFGTSAVQRYCSGWSFRFGQPTNSTSILASSLQPLSKYICEFISFNVPKLPDLTLVSAFMKEEVDQYYGASASCLGSLCQCYIS